MTDPRTDRPDMPGYGVAGPDTGTGLLPWSWAVERLTRSHDYWLATRRPDGHPHAMPVWGVWLDGALWFSSGLRSRKARNLGADGRCAVTTDDPLEPVVVEGEARRVEAPEGIAGFAAAVDAKYGTSYGAEFYDPAVNGVWRVAPTWAFGLLESDFAGSPTRWTFG
ncbi:MAG TPA: pyridoxamine 5'-phosphate oxidase family protein [Acidimicrobiales bacterium]|nr:pyridoxamine 5'-phosphate oxidase family protein [Acidimicrobiales bacterium]